MATFRDLLSAAKAEITEVDTSEAADPHRRRLARARRARARRVRPGCARPAIHIPRGHLEAQVESRLPDKTAPVVVYCAGGVRSGVRGQDAAASSATPTSSRWPAGSARWKDEGRPWKTPVVAHRRAAQPLQAPHPAARGRRGRPGEAARREGAACSAPAASARPRRCTSRPRASARIGIVDMDEVDASNLQRQILHNLDRIGDRKVDSAKKTLYAAQPRRRRRHLRHPPRRQQHHRHHRPATTSSSTAPTTSRAATCSTTPA